MNLALIVYDYGTNSIIKEYYNQINFAKFQYFRYDPTSTKLIFASGLVNDRIIRMMETTTYTLDQGVLMAFNDPNTYKYFNGISYDAT